MSFADMQLIVLLCLHAVDDSMLRARVTLQNIKTLTYNFPSTDVQLATEFTEQLEQLYQFFYSKLPSEAGLIVLQQTHQSLRSTRKRDHKNENSTTYANLPPRKKFKSSLTSRVGAKEGTN